MSLLAAAKSLYLRAAVHIPLLRRARNLQWRHRAKQCARLMRGVTVDEHCVFFEAFGGRQYACSPRALFEQMCRDARFDGWKFVWSFTGARAADREVLPAEVRARARVVVHESPEYFQCLAKAKYWVQNNRIPEYLQPGERHVYIQCWHGTPLKKLGFDVPDGFAGGALNSPKELAHRYKIDADKWDYLISPSPYTTEHLCSAFGLAAARRKRVVLESGYPRNDGIARTLLPSGASERVAEIRKALGIPEGKRVLLYAPTYREDSFNAAKGYTFQLPLDLGLMKRRLGDEWVVLLRLHYYVSSRLDVDAWDGFALDVSHVDDVNDLYCASDVLCTDYSSVLFDYANTSRPLVFFWPDVAHYVNELHGFYLNPEELPGPKCATSEEVVQALEGIDGWDSSYGATYKTFRATFCSLDDGHASERVIERVFSTSANRL